MSKSQRNRKRKPKPRKLVPVAAPDQTTTTTASEPELYRFHPLDMAEADAATRARRELNDWVGSLRGRITTLFDEVEQVLAAVREPTGLLSGALDQVTLVKVMGCIEQAEMYASVLRAAKPPTAACTPIRCASPCTTRSNSN